MGMNEGNFGLAPESAEQMEGHEVAADGDHLAALLWGDSPDWHASAKAFDGATGFGQRIACGGERRARTINHRVDAGWLQAVKESELPELCRFAAGIERDQSAVLAALSLAWSNGPVEAQVQKLKVVKRQMFGRAKFDLLRQRVLHRV